MTLKNIILNLIDSDKMDKILTEFKRKLPDSELYLSIPDNKNILQNCVHFLIFDPIASSEQVKLLVKIQKILSCKITDEEENIFIHSNGKNNKNYLEGKYSDKVLFSKDNKNEVKKFLDRTYPLDSATIDNEPKSNAFFKEQSSQKIQKSEQTSLIDDAVLIKTAESIINLIQSNSEITVVLQDVNEESRKKIFSSVETRLNSELQNKSKKVKLYE